MKNSTVMTLIASCLAVTALALTTPAAAKDLGSPDEVRSIKTLVKAKFGAASNVCISHDWAMCTSNQENANLTVLLHRSHSKWTVSAHDGGAYDPGTLRNLGVPASDVPQLLQSYR